MKNFFEGENIPEGIVNGQGIKFEFEANGLI